MFTDTNHLRVEDPGRVDGNAVFTYLDAFDPDQNELAELKAQYQHGGLGNGNGKIKARLEAILQDLIAPIREHRAQLSKDPSYVLEIIRQGTERAQHRTESTKREVVDALGLFQL